MAYFFWHKKGVSIVFHNFLQFSLDIELSHVYFLWIGFVYPMVLKKKMLCTHTSMVTYFLQDHGEYFMRPIKDNVIYGLFGIFQKMSLNIKSLLHSDSTGVIKEL